MGRRSSPRSAASAAAAAAAASADAAATERESMLGALPSCRLPLLLLRLLLLRDCLRSDPTWWDRAAKSDSGGSMAMLCRCPLSSESRSARSHARLPPTKAVPPRPPLPAIASPEGTQPLRPGEHSSRRCLSPSCSAACCCCRFRSALRVSPTPISAPRGSRAARSTGSSAPTPPRVERGCNSARSSPSTAGNLLTAAPSLRAGMLAEAHAGSVGSMAVWLKSLQRI
jgi:hypothetical protein